MSYRSFFLSFFLDPVFTTFIVGFAVFGVLLLLHDDDDRA